MTICELIERCTEIWETDGNLEVYVRRRGTDGSVRVKDVYTDMTESRGPFVELLL